MSMPWLLVAVARERRLFQPRIMQTLRTRPTPIWLCEHEGRPFVLGETGVGGIRTAETLDWLGPRVSPQYVFMAGFAGALVDDLRVGDGVSIHGVVCPRGISHGATITLPAPRVGRILTSDRFVGDPAEKRRLATEHAALAVEMETSYVAGWCAERGVRWGGVRVISDDAHAPIDGEVFELFEEGVSPWKALKGVARKPILLRDLWRLAGATNLASRIIAEALTAAIHGDRLMHLTAPAERPSPPSKPEPANSSIRRHLGKL